VIDRVIDRVHAARPQTIVVAIPDTGENDSLAEYITIHRMPVHLFRGHESDVLKRFSDAASWAFEQGRPTRSIVRITGDCPLVDPALIVEVVEYHQRHGIAYAGRTNDPDGTDVEAFTFDALMRANEMTDNPRHREHVTTYMRECMNGKILSSNCSTENIKYSVDTPADLERCAGLIHRLGVHAGWREYMEALQ
jgi:spore coat polysaccharide biosynthesis protein SpsF (cytidylyltransferase family)